MQSFVKGRFNFSTSPSLSNRKGLENFFTTLQSSNDATFYPPRPSRCTSPDTLKIEPKILKIGFLDLLFLFNFEKNVQGLKSEMASYQASIKQNWISNLSVFKADSICFPIPFWHASPGTGSLLCSRLRFMVTSIYIAKQKTILADKPICRSEQKRIYGVARNEAADILCEVDAFPPPESFKWWAIMIRESAAILFVLAPRSFNNTAETFEMPQSDYRIHSSQASTLSYTPVKVSQEWASCLLVGSKV